jgi:hypothetical protein
MRERMLRIPGRSHGHRFATVKAALTGLSLLCVSLIGIASCGGPGGGEGQTDPDTLSRAQKDSIISTLPVPGAGAVGRALDAAEAARARAEQHDTMGGP